MCLGSYCGHNIASILYVIERLALCCAMTAVVSCLVSTLMIMLAMGIGLGYNYCFVDTKAIEMKPILGEMTWGEENVRRSLAKINRTSDTAPAPHLSTTEGDLSLVQIPRKRYFPNPGYNAKRYASQINIETSTNSETAQSRATSNTASASEWDLDNMEIKPTMVVPLQKVDLLSFIKKLRESNKNVTLEFIQ